MVYNFEILWVYTTLDQGDINQKYHIFIHMLVYVFI